ncbi:hypothetical protein Tco_0531851 [Tanacetum coccineum]
MACSLPHTDSEVEAWVQRLINEDKGRQDVLLNLAFQFEDSCAFDKDRKLHLSMYRKATQLERQIGAKLAWFQEKYSGHTHGGIGCSSSHANCPLPEKKLHQLCMDEEALKEILEEVLESKKFRSGGLVLPPCDVVTFGPHAHTFLDHDSKHQSSESCVVEFQRISLTGFRSCASRSQNERLKSRRSKNK